VSKFARFDIDFDTLGHPASTVSTCLRGSRFTPTYARISAPFWATRLLWPKVKLQASGADTVSSTIMPVNAGRPGKYRHTSAVRVSRVRLSAGRHRPATMEDANGDFAGRKALNLDSTTTVGIDGMDEHQARLCYRRSTSSQRSPVPHIGSTGRSAIHYCGPLASRCIAGNRSTLRPRA
jgi:hypothetical protein